MKIRYNPKLKSFSRQLRSKSTLSEVLLWNQLKARKMKGYQFMRQKPIDEYIVDFYCNKLKLVIEIDGESHSEKTEADLKRQKKLESMGLSVLRFYDLDVKKNMAGVVSVIERWIDNNPLAPFSKGDYKGGERGLFKFPLNKGGERGLYGVRLFSPSINL